MARNHVILKFLLLSAAAHALALVSWPASTPPKMRISAALSVGFAALEPAPPATPAKVKSTQPATTPASIAKTRSAPKIGPQPVPAKRRNSRRPIRRMRATTPTRNAQRSETVIANTDPAQQASEAPHTPAEHTTPVSAHPWEPAWGSVPHYSAEDVLRTAKSVFALLRHQQWPTTRPAGIPNTVNSGEAVRALIRGRLQTDLSRYFSYPPIARQRGWQGHVRVAFTVQADGQLTDVRITHSSGYHVLDASALEALRRVGWLPQAREWLHGQALTMELPVIYRLEN